MNIAGGWSKYPHFIYDAMPLMSGAESKCTAVLVRETYGYHRSQVRLTYRDFMQQTGIKGKTTIAAALKAIEARGFFRRSQASDWLVCESPVPVPEKQENGAPGGRNGSKQPAAGSVNGTDGLTAAGKNRKSSSISLLERTVLDLERSVSELMQSNAELGRSISEQNSLLVELIRSTAAANGVINEPGGQLNGTISEAKGTAKRAIGAENGAGPGTRNEPPKDRKSTESEPLQYYKEKRSPAGKERERGGSKRLPRARPQPQPTGQNLQSKATHGKEVLAHDSPWRDRPPPQRKGPSPRSTEERELAAHPATEVWLMAGLAWPGWERLKIVTGRLGAGPQVEVLQKARELWLMAGYRMGNVGGILDWYEALCRDRSWQPFTRTKGQSDRTAAGKGGARDETMNMLLGMREELIHEQGTEDGGLLNHVEGGLSADGLWRGVGHGLPAGVGGY